MLVPFWVCDWASFYVRRMTWSILNFRSTEYMTLICLNLAHLLEMYKFFLLLNILTDCPMYCLFRLLFHLFFSRWSSFFLLIVCYTCLLHHAAFRIQDKNISLSGVPLQFSVDRPSNSRYYHRPQHRTIPQSVTGRRQGSEAHHSAPKAIIRQMPRHIDSVPILIRAGVGGAVQRAPLGSS